MITPFLRFSIFIFFVFSYISSFATHIVGGYIEMTQSKIDNQKFTFTLNLYFNNLNFIEDEERLVETENYYVRIYGKNDNLPRRTIKVNYKRYEKFEFDNVACEQALGLSTRKYMYVSNEQNLDFSEFSEEGGYYVAFARCCREASLVNIEDAPNAGLLFYLSFPPLQNTQKYSTPQVKNLKGKFICANEPFSFNLNVEDSDGDLLNYTFVTPINGTNTPNTSKVIVEAGPYTDVKWKFPYGVNNVISGEKRLTIDKDTGEMSVKTKIPGTYVFTVKIEKIRFGQVIGFITHDFQILVTNCPKVGPPEPIITVDNVPIVKLIFCESSEKKTLRIEDGNDWVFQWLKDGEPIKNAILNRLEVSTSGTYSVMKNYSKVCSQSSFSKEIPVIFNSTYTPKIISSTLSKCLGDTTKLVTIKNPNYEFFWTKNGNEFSGKVDSVIVNSTAYYGLYGISKEGSCKTTKDSILISFVAPPKISKTLNQDYSFCTNDKLKLEIVEPNVINYELFDQNGIKSQSNTTGNFEIIQTGTYYFKLFSQANCFTISPNFKVSESSSATLDFNLPRNICENDSKITLKGNIVGGIFSGKGIDKDTFSPKLAGIGNHTINYTFTSNLGCSGNTNKEVTVVKNPSFIKKTIYPAQKGVPFLLDIDSDQSNIDVTWLPPTYLSSNTLLKPVCTPENDIVYKITAMNGFGCKTTDSVKVLINFEVNIPSAFSPNNDGLNEEWKIFGLENYNQAEIIVINSWGETVFYSKGIYKPWNGKYKNQALPFGAYTYRINLNKNNKIYTGVLSLIE